MSRPAATTAPPARAAAVLAAASLTVLLALTGAAWAQDLVITDDGLSAEEITVEAGEPIDILNEGGTEIRLADEGGAWDSGPLGPGESFSVTLDSPGTYAFSSEDGSLAGTIVVEAVGEGGATEAGATETATDPAGTEQPTPAATEAATEEAVPTGMADTGAPVTLLLAIAGAGLLGGAVLLRRSR